MSQILEATESFTTEIDGERFFVVREKTHIDSEHPLAAKCPDYFKPLADRLTFSRDSTADATPGQDPVRTGRPPSGKTAAKNGDKPLERTPTDGGGEPPQATTTE